jgi:hypothetical protein
VAKITDKECNNQTQQLKCQRRTPAQTRFFVEVLMKSKERENELSESSIRVNSGEIARN